MSATPLTGSPCPRFLIVPKGLQSGSLCSGLLSQQVATLLSQLLRPKGWAHPELLPFSLIPRLSLQQILGPTWNIYPTSASSEVHVYHSCPGFLQRMSRLVSRLLPYRLSATLSSAIRVILWKNEPDSITSVFRILPWLPISQRKTKMQSTVPAP